MSIVPVIAGGLARLGGPLAVRALPVIERVVARGVLVAGGATIARQIYDIYVRLRGTGVGHTRARRMAHQQAGFTFRRRRMRPTNVRALRRAIRRVRGFQRVARKVGVLGVSRRGRPRFVRRRRRFFPRRVRGDIEAEEMGDVSPFLVEDSIDMADEMEDLGAFEDGDDTEAAGE